MALCYRIFTKKPVAKAGDADEHVRQRWAGSMAGVREAKGELCSTYGLGPKEVNHEEIEVPTSKAGVLEFLNTEATIKV